jgi:hypothetical protein
MQTYAPVVLDMVRPAGFHKKRKEKKGKKGGGAVTKRIPYRILHFTKCTNSN